MTELVRAIKSIDHPIGRQGQKLLEGRRERHVLEELGRLGEAALVEDSRTQRGAHLGHFVSEDRLEEFRRDDAAVVELGFQM